MTPRNFTNGTCLTKSWFILIVISVFDNDLFFYLKMTKSVLDALIDNLLALSHFTTLFISFCTVLDKVLKHEFEEKAFVSSAYNTKERISLQFSMSLMYRRNSNGPRIEPCGTPVVTFISIDLCCLYILQFEFFHANNL